MPDEPDSPMDDVARAELAEKLLTEANSLVVRLGLGEFSESWNMDDLYDVEKQLRVKLRAVNRLKRRADNWTMAYAEMVKTDADKAREQEHAKLTEHFMNTVGMSKLEAPVAASGVIAMRNLEKPEEEEPIN
jgi:hypothetical protein